MSRDRDVPGVTATGVSLSWADESVRWCGPYVVRVGELVIEFRDAEATQVSNVWVIVGGRRIHVELSRSTAEVSVRLESDGVDEAFILCSKRTGVIERYSVGLS